MTDNIDPNPSPESLAFKRYRAAMDLHSIVSITDRKGRITDVNDLFCQLSGYSRDELLGQTHALVNSGYHPKEFWVEMWRTIAQGNPWQGDVCNRAKDGSLYWVRATMTAMLDPDGVIIGYCGIRTDITAQKATEHNLVQSVQRSRLMQKISAIATVSDSFNDALARSLEIICDTLDWPIGHVFAPSDEDSLSLCSSGIWSLANPKLYQPFVDATKSFVVDAGEGLPGHALEAGHAVMVPDVKEDESFLRRDSSKTLPIASGVSVPVILDGQVESVLEFFTERPLEEDDPILDTLNSLGQLLGRVLQEQRTNSARRIAQERLDLAMSVANVGLWDWNLQSGRVFFSEEFYTMLGYKPGELSMELQTWLDLCHPDDLPAALADIERHKAGETDEYRNEQRLRRSDGSWMWILDSGRIVERSPSGEAVRMIGLHLDIEEQRLARREAEAASEAKSEFLANMSHEIRTPMSAILGFADLLDTDEDTQSDPKQAAEAIGLIRSNANHLLTIINDILDVSKIEAGKMTVELVAMSPARIVQEVQQLMLGRCEEKNIKLTVEYDSAIPASIQSDPTRLRQILVNLVGNAAKFTSNGSVSIRLAYADNFLQLSIVDTGIGMTPEQRDVIASFAAFTQADNSVTRRFGGTGLGLRISNSLTQMLGGGLRIESEHGKGSTFTALISTGDLCGVQMLEPSSVPTLAEMDATSSVRSSSTPDQKPLDGFRVLLAEDMPANQRLITVYLKKAGAEVFIAENGRIAVDKVMAASKSGDPYSLILMDMQMPELDGYGATGELRKSQCTTPVIALTAHAMDGDRQKCINAGCDDYLTKPINRKTLIETCVAQLEG